MPGPRPLLCCPSSLDRGYALNPEIKLSLTLPNHVLSLRNNKESKMLNLCNEELSKICNIWLVSVILL
jgi:hypothetical protein